MPTTRKKLLVFDVEGTLFRTKIRLPGTAINSTIWQAIASELGPDAVSEEIRTHEKWHRGEYATYLEWMSDTIKIHQSCGLTQIMFRRIINSAKYNKRVRKTVNAIDRTRYEIVLVSGGFKELAARAQLDFGIKHSFSACEYLFDSTGRLSAFNLLPCDFDGKIHFIKLILQAYGLAENEFIFVGDGLNDIPLAKRAKLSIAYNANHALNIVSDFQIDEFDQLLKILKQMK